MQRNLHICSSSTIDHSCFPPACRMPIFIYAFPVTATAAALLSLAAALFEGATAEAAGVTGGVLGWLSSGTYCPLVLYLAVGPGIVGHTGFNTLLK